MTVTISDDNEVDGDIHTVEIIIKLYDFLPIRPVNDVKSSINNIPHYFSVRHTEIQGIPFSAKGDLWLESKKLINHAL